MVKKLDAKKLYRHCDPKSLGFKTTDDLSPLNDIIGQERAVKALELGLGIRDRRYNIYVAGDPGTGKTSIVKTFLERVSAKEDKPPDLCYVRNFKDPYRPLPLQLPAGEGIRLCEAMDQMIDGLKLSIPAAFESEEYRERRRKIDELAVANRAKIFEALEEEASNRGFSLQRTPIGINAIPVLDGKPLTEEQFQQLEPEKRQEFEKGQAEIQPLVQEAIHEVSSLEEERVEQMRQLNQQVASFLIQPAVSKVKMHFANQSEVLEYLKDVAEDLMKNVDQFFSESDEDEDGDGGKSPNPIFGEENDPFNKYKVNVLVDNTNTDGAPVVVLDNSTYPNLFGKVEYRAMMGTLISDFTLIKAGALHQANGGYLVLSADNLMRNPLSWEGLKVAFKAGEVGIEDASSLTGQTTIEGLRPRPIPLDVKVIIVGSHYLYQMIEAYDEDFKKFFNVKCEFSDRVPWKARYVKMFGPLIKKRCEEHCLLPFESSGVARLVEYSAQLVGSQEKLSARFSDIMVIAREAVYWAQKSGSEQVSIDHVEQAIEEKHHRSNLIEEHIQEMIEDGNILVSVKKTAVGQVNGLSVYDLGDISFGRPTRITATVFMGKDGMVDIESEADLSGKIHTKSQFIIKGWFGETFAGDKPLSLSGNLTFEQSYGPVDGDSASCAELIALLSALSGVPVKQELAITGSMNQKGEVQPIGGVNEKVEGFYHVCKAKGLTGDQGVVIPAQNEKDLMLHRDVVQAVEDGKFHVWSAKTLDHAVELLTGDHPGKRSRSGKFPKGSLYSKVNERLQSFNKGLDGDGEDDS